MRAKQQQHRDGYSPQSTNSIKLETDDLSNHSDSFSSDTSSQLKSSLNSETSQWMFPGFMPVCDQRRLSENSVDSRSTPPEINGIQIKKEHIQDDERIPAQLPGRKSNKRKSAKPQWSYEGTQLDRSRQTIEIDSDNFEAQPNAEVQNSEIGSSDNTEQALNLKNNVKAETLVKKKIEKLEEAIQSNDIDWDEGETE